MHSILMPMILLCVHKHSLGACGVGGMSTKDDAIGFMHEHLRLIFKGLEIRPAVAEDKKPRRAA